MRRSHYRRRRPRENPIPLIVPILLGAAAIGGAAWYLTSKASSSGTNALTSSGSSGSGGPITAVANGQFTASAGPITVNFPSNTQCRIYRASDEAVVVSDLSGGSTLTFTGVDGTQYWAVWTPTVASGGNEMCVINVGQVAAQVSPASAGPSMSSNTTSPISTAQNAINQGQNAVNAASNAANQAQGVFSSFASSSSGDSGDSGSDDSSDEG